MKKSFFLGLAFLFIFSLNAFCVSGFEFGVNIPLLGGLNFDDAEVSGLVPPSPLNETYHTHAMTFGFNSGVLLQAGYTIGGEKIAGTFLAEIGYSHDDFYYHDNGTLTIGSSETVRNVKVHYTFESIQIGILPKLNIKNFCIGIGGGVKIPFYGKYTEKGSVKRTSGTTELDYSRKINFGETFESSVMPYIKVTFDYSFFLTEKMAIVLGLQSGYNFGMTFKKGDPYLLQRSMSSFEIGAQVGFRFGQKL